MRSVLIMTRNDERGGTTIYEDGSKVFYAGSRSADLVILTPEGYWRIVTPADRSPFSADEPDEKTAIRTMTLHEHFEWEWAREEAYR